MSLNDQRIEPPCRNYDGGRTISQINTLRKSGVAMDNKTPNDDSDNTVKPNAAVTIPQLTVVTSNVNLSYTEETGPANMLDKDVFGNVTKRSMVSEEADVWLRKLYALFNDTRPKLRADEPSTVGDVLCKALEIYPRDVKELFYICTTVEDTGQVIKGQLEQLLDKLEAI